jgi:protein tyrosine/serine phosphatase
MRTAPEYMTHALAHMDVRYGGIERYLSHIGLTDAESAALKARLLE